MREQLNFTVEIKSEVFDGPLDLMLSLISKHKIDIQDIEITVLLEQFLKYIEETQENDIELAGEFLEMAARLIYIKSVSLLPKHEAEQLKKELEGALIEYALCKAAAERLRSLFVGDAVFTRSPDEAQIDFTYGLLHLPAELVEAAGIISYRDKVKNQPPPPLPHNEIKIDYVSVFSAIICVLRRIRKGGKLEIKTLFAGVGRSEKVATFLALLELSTHGRIAFSKNLKFIEFRGNSKGS